MFRLQNHNNTNNKNYSVEPKSRKNKISKKKKEKAQTEEKSFDVHILYTVQSTLFSVHYAVFAICIYICIHFYIIKIIWKRNYSNPSPGKIKLKR